MNLREKRPRGKADQRRAVLENLKKARSGGGRTELHEVRPYPFALRWSDADCSSYS